MAKVKPEGSEPWLSRLAHGSLTRDELLALHNKSGSLIPYLEEVVKRGDEATAVAAVDALAALADPRATAALGEALLYGRTTVAARAAAALGVLPTTQAAIISLEEALCSPAYAVRREAELSLARLAARNEPILSRRAATALATMPPRDVAPACAAGLRRLTGPEYAALLDAGLSINAEAALCATLQGLDQEDTANVARQALYRHDLVGALLAQFTPENAPTLAFPLAVACRGLLKNILTDAPTRQVLTSQVTRALLTAYLKSSDDDERQAIVKALHHLGTEALDSIAQHLADLTSEEARQTAELLCQLGWVPTPNSLGARYWIALERWDECLALGPEAIGPLVEVFLGNDRRLSQQAASVLDRLGWVPDAPDLLARFYVALERWDKAAALGTEALPALAETLREVRHEARRSGDPARLSSLRHQIVRLLARIGRAPANALLEETLIEDPLETVRLAALEALHSMEGGDPAALARALMEDARPRELRLPDQPAPSATVRMTILDVLAEQSDTACLTVIVHSALHDPDESCREHARFILRSIWEHSPNTVAAVLADLHGGLLAEALEQCGLPTVEALVDLLSTSDPQVLQRAQAGLRALSQKGAEVVPALRAALHSASPEGRIIAAGLLESLGQAPTSGEDHVAYLVAKGDLHGAEASGEAAVPVLLEALGAYPLQAATEMALALLRLGLDPRHEALGTLAERLRSAAEQPDERVTQVVRSSEGGEDSDQTVTLLISHEDERREARRLLQALDAARARARRFSRRL